MAASVSAWIAALDERPADAEAFRAAVDALVRAEDWRTLLEVAERHAPRYEERWSMVAESLEWIAGQELEARERSELLTALGDIWHARLERPDHAVQHYQAALRVQRDNEIAIERARAVYRSQSKWAMVQRLYQVQWRITANDETRARLLTEAGIVQRDVLRDPTGAIDYFERALGFAPDYAPALAALRGDDAPDSRSELAALKEQLEGASGALRAELLVQVAEILLAMEDEAPEDPAPYLAEANTLEPGSPEGMRAIAEHLRRRGSTQELADVLDALSRSDAPTPTRVSASLELHELASESEDEARAEAALLRALTLDPGNADAVESARRWYGARGDAERLADVLEEALRRRSGGVRELEWHRELGQLWADRLGDLERAEGHFRRVAMIDGADREMLTFYVRYFESKGQQKKRISKLRQLRDQASSDAERYETSWEMSNVAVELLDDPVRAVDVWTWYVKHVPDDPRGRQSLRGMLHAAKRWNRLAEFLKVELSRLPDEDVSGRIATHLELAEMYGSHVELPMLEVQAYQAVLGLDPAHPAAVDAVVGRWEDSQRWLDAAEQLDAAAEVTEDGDDRTRWSRRAASLWATRLANEERAVLSLQRVVEAGGGDEALLSELEALLSSTGQSDARIDVVRRRAALAEPAERESLLREALEDVAEPGSRRLLLADLVDVTQSRDGAVVRELAGLLDAQGETHAALTIFERYVESLEHPDGATLAELAQRLLDEGTRLDEAALRFEEALALAPDQAGAVEGLMRTLVESQRWLDVEDAARRFACWDDAVDRLAAEGLRSGDADRFVDAGRLALAHGQDPARAVHLLEQALDVRPDDPLVAAELAEGYAAIGDAAGRATMLEVLARHAQGDARKALQLELAALCEDELETPSAALGWWLAAFDSDPSDTSVREEALVRARALERVGDWAAAVRQGAAILPSGDARLAHYRALAEVYEHELRNSDHAIDYRRRVLLEKSDDIESLDALAGLYERAQRWDDLASVLEGRAAFEEDAAARELTVARLIALRIEHLDAPGDPLAEANALLGTELTSPDALSALRSALERRDRWAEAAAIAERQAEQSTEAGERFDALEVAFDLLLRGEGVTENVLDRAGALIDSAPSEERAAGVADKLLSHESAQVHAERVADLAEPAYRAATRWDDVANVLRDRIRRRESEEALPLVRELLRVETELREDARAATRVWVEWIARGPMSADDVRASDAAAEALDARDAFLRAWSRRLSDVRVRSDVPGWAREPHLVLAREALDRRVRVAENADAGTLAVWVAALRDGWRAADQRSRYLDLARALIESGHAGPVVESHLHADLARTSLDEDPAAAWRHVLDALRGGVMDDAILDVFEAVQGHGSIEEGTSALEAALDAARTAGTQARVHLLLGAGYRDALGQRREAIRHFEAAVFVCDEPAAPLEALAALYEAEGDHAARVAVLERLADLDAARRAALLLEASASAERGGDARTIELAEAARSAGSMEAAQTLRRLYRGAERWDALAELLADLAASADEEEANELLAERAEVLEQHLLRPRAAAATWETLRGRLPQDTGVLRRLERIYTSLADTGARIAVLEAQLDTDEDVADVRRRLAQARVESEEFELAGDIARELLAAERDDAVALDVLEQVVEQRDDTDAAEALFEAYGELERWQDASRLSRGVAERARDRDTALAWLERARDVEARSLGDPHAAFALTLEIFRRSGGERPSLKSIREAAERVDGWRSLVTTVEEVVGDREDVGLATFLGLVYADRLTDYERAGRWVDRALALDPDHVPALWLRTGIDAEHPLSTRHIDPLRRLARRVDATRRAEVLTRLAEVYRALRHTSDELAVIAELEDMAPTPAIVERHDALLEANGALEAIARRWERRASQSEPTDAVALWLRAATLRRTRLNDAQGALGNLRHLAAISPGVAELDAELETFVHDASVPTGVVHQAMRLRIDALRRAEDDTRLAGVLDRSMMQVPADERPALRAELARLHERAGDADAAFAAWVGALRDDPASTEALHALHTHAERAWRWGALAEALREIGDANNHLGLLREVATIEEGPLDDPDAALDTWRVVAQRSGRHADDDHVRRLLLSQRDWDGVIRWHRVRAARADDVEVARASLLRVAALELAVRSDTDAAMDAMRTAHELDPLDASIAEALAQLATRSERWDVLIATLEDALERTDDAAQAAAWRRRLASVHRDAHGDTERAAATFRELLQAEPEDVALWDELEATLHAGGAWHSLLAVLDERAESLDDDDARERAARVAAEELDDPAAAIQRAQAIETPSAGLRASMRAWLPQALNPESVAMRLLELSSGDERGATLAVALEVVRTPDVRAELALEAATLAHSEGRVDDGVALLLDELDHAAARDDVWQRLVEWSDEAPRIEALAERMLASALRYGDPAREVRASLAVGWLASDEAELSELAEPLFLRVLELEPAHEEALDALEGLYVSQERADAFLNVLVRASEVPDAERRATLSARVARIAELRLDDRERALEAWAAVLEVAPDDRDALREVARLSAELERWPEAVDAMQRLADAAVEPGDRASWLADAAVLLIENSDPPHGAVPLLEAASELTPDDDSLVDRLVDVFLRLDQASAAVDALEERAESLSEAPARAADYWARASALRVESLDDPDGAVDASERALALDPTQGREDAHIALLRRAHRVRALVDRLEATLERGDVDAVSVHLEIASLAADALGDSARAGRHLAEARTLAPARVDVRVALAEALRQQGDIEGALAEFDAAMEHAPQADRARLLSEKGRVALSAGRREEAVVWLEEAFALDPSQDELFDRLVNEFESRRAWPALRDVLLRRAAHAEGDDRAQIWKRIAGLAAGPLDEDVLVRTALEEAHAARPDDDETSNWLLRIYIDSGEIDEAIPLLDDLTARAESDGSRSDLHRLYYLKGRIEELREQPELAIDAYERSFRIDATYVPNLLAMGRIHAQAERYEDALRVLQTALLYQRSIHSDARKADLFFWLGTVRHATGERERAMDMYRRALAVVPDAAAVKEALAKLEAS